MKYLRETTDWNIPNHVYVVDGTRLYGYAKHGVGLVHWFSVPMKNFRTKNRTFVDVTKEWEAYRVS